MGEHETKLVQRAIVERSAKKRTLEESIAYLQRSLRDPTIVMDLQSAAAAHPSISTGHEFIDSITGIGGLPRGKLTELYGRESSGKSTLLLQAIAAEQRNGGCALYIDLEYSFDRAYAAALGVSLEKSKLLVSQPLSAEEVFEVIREFVDNDHVSIIVVDSVAALTPKADLDDNAVVGFARPGSQSSIVSQGIKQLAGRVNRGNVALVFINQIRSVISKSGRGPTETTPGGNALKFFASLRLELVKVGSIVGQLRDPFSNTVYKGVVGLRVRVKASKNKCAAPFKQTEVVLKMGEGFDTGSSVLALAVAHGIIERGKTGWFMLEKFGRKNVRGEDALRKVLAEDAELNAQVMAKVQEAGPLSGPSVVSMETLGPVDFGSDEGITALLDGEVDGAPDAPDSGDTPSEDA